MKTVFDAYNLLDQWAPFASACSFDNCGILVGDGSMPCTHVGIALDVTPAVLHCAVEVGCDLIVSHHPVIFNPLSHLSIQSMPYQLAHAGIACIAAHTNLDKASGGTNDCVATLAMLSEIHAPEGCDDLARVGILPSPCSATQFVDQLKPAFSAPRIRFLDGGIPVRRVMTVAGSGGDFLELALQLGVDTLVTGDIKHDRFITAQSSAINVIELCHQDAEVTVLPALQKRFSDAGYKATVLDPVLIQAR